ncbi:pyruvoyl-dependent arginine decarboxylase [Halarchaeum acidiphilum MH1-52-1]|uniref:arginine decarboxylase n=1 Tax=Halarchaeum acidiphilum MH1-52-1 TaxID=1261545 RepID=U2YU22_9EURY|nr:pyruvoyl-dependent arginine decarboxylase [Halarchaeum acidiphilum]GAD52242.1 pyruvoyl-dependent arginine decarboxylase [Halarchaeum acidiphilum MH1-52-1]
MDTISVVWGTGTAPTAMSAYDAALADANVHNYNLVAVSSVIPADATVETVGTASDLGPAGERLTVVEAHANAAGPRHVSAGLGWTRDPDGPGLFYEVADETDPADVAERVRAGLDAGRDLRDWDFADEHVETTTVEAAPGEYAAAVVVACYGESEPIL